MRITANYWFKLNKKYAVSYRCDRYFFEVISRSAKTAQLKLVGHQKKNYNHIGPKIIDPIVDAQPQQIHIRMNKEINGEYGYITIYYDLWGKPTQTRVLIDSKDEWYDTYKSYDGKQLVER